MKKVLTYLAYISAVLGVIGQMDTIPFVSAELADLILGMAVVLTVFVGDVRTKLGDFFDDGKMNNSFEPKG